MTDYNSDTESDLADAPAECPACAFTDLKRYASLGIYAERWSCPACDRRGHRLKAELKP
ncbi:hypothetical protein [Natronosalvus rutilus]|uniref:Uncharacterized protein n=1 Tax=Natronosalvus rutilus TaxID=2953753 RepID=A0A9E7NFE3_9EURY|nr:hypothetical protein [Natronosalvus rutilus]UTF56000.1 hypothetical protein NGM29_20650 [Natronosalvus rutilus]